MTVDSLPVFRYMSDCVVSWICYWWLWIPCRYSHTWVTAWWVGSTTDDCGFPALFQYMCDCMVSWICYWWLWIPCLYSSTWVTAWWVGSATDDCGFPARIPVHEWLHGELDLLLMTVDSLPVFQYMSDCMVSWIRYWWLWIPCPYSGTSVTAWWVGSATDDCGFPAHIPVHEWLCGKLDLLLMTVDSLPICWYMCDCVVSWIRYWWLWFPARIPVHEWLLDELDLLLMTVDSLPVFQYMCDCMVSWICYWWLWIPCPIQYMSECMVSWIHYWWLWIPCPYSGTWVTMWWVGSATDDCVFPARIPVHVWLPGELDMLLMTVDSLPIFRYMSDCMVSWIRYWWLWIPCPYSSTWVTMWWVGSGTDDCGFPARIPVHVWLHGELDLLLMTVDSLPIFRYTSDCLMSWICYWWLWIPCPYSSTWVTAWWVGSATDDCGFPAHIPVHLWLRGELDLLLMTVVPCPYSGTWVIMW